MPCTYRAFPRNQRNPRVPKPCSHYCRSQNAGGALPKRDRSENSHWSNAENYHAPTFAGHDQETTVEGIRYCSSVSSIESSSEMPVSSQQHLMLNGTSHCALRKQSRVGAVSPGRVSVPEYCRALDASVARPRDYGMLRRNSLRKSTNEGREKLYERTSLASLEAAETLSDRHRRKSHHRRLSSRHDLMKNNVVDTLTFSKKGWDALTSMFWDRLPSCPDGAKGFSNSGFTGFFGKDVSKPLLSPTRSEARNASLRDTKSPKIISAVDQTPPRLLDSTSSPIKTGSQMRVSRQSVRHFEHRIRDLTDQVLRLKKALQIQKKTSDDKAQQLGDFIERLVRDKRVLLERLDTANEEREQQELVLSNLGAQVEDMTQQLAVAQSDVLHYKQLLRSIRPHNPSSSVSFGQPFRATQKLPTGYGIPVRLQLNMTCEGFWNLHMTFETSQTIVLNLKHLIQIDLSPVEQGRKVRLQLVTTSKGTLQFEIPSDDYSSLQQCGLLFQLVQEPVTANASDCHPCTSQVLVEQQLHSFFSGQELPAQLPVLSPAQTLAQPPSSSFSASRFTFGHSVPSPFPVTVYKGASRQQVLPENPRAQSFSAVSRPTPSYPHCFEAPTTSFDGQERDCHPFVPNKKTSLRHPERPPFENQLPCIDQIEATPDGRPENSPQIDHLLQRLKRKADIVRHELRCVSQDALQPRYLEKPLYHSTENSSGLLCSRTTSSFMKRRSPRLSPNKPMERRRERKLNGQNLHLYDLDQVSTYSSDVAPQPSCSRRYHGRKQKHFGTDNLTLPRKTTRGSITKTPEQKQAETLWHPTVHVFPSCAPDSPVTSALKQPLRALEHELIHETASLSSNSTSSSGSGRRTPPHLRSQQYSVTNDSFLFVNPYAPNDPSYSNSPRSEQPKSSRNFEDSHPTQNDEDYVGSSIASASSWVDSDDETPPISRNCCSQRALIPCSTTNTVDRANCRRFKKRIPLLKASKLQKPALSRRRQCCERKRLCNTAQQKATARRSLSPRRKSPTQRGDNALHIPKVRTVNGYLESIRDLLEENKTALHL